MDQIISLKQDRIFCSSNFFFSISETPKGPQVAPKGLTISSIFNITTRVYLVASGEYMFIFIGFFFVVRIISEFQNYRIADFQEDFSCKIRFNNLVLKYADLNF